MQYRSCICLDICDSRRRLTVGGGHDFSLLPRRFHRSSHSEQLADLQPAVLLVGFSEFLQLSGGVEAPISPITKLYTCWWLKKTTTQNNTATDQNYVDYKTTNTSGRFRRFIVYTNVRLNLKTFGSRVE